MSIANKCILMMVLAVISTSAKASGANSFEAKTASFDDEYDGDRYQGRFNSFCLFSTDIRSRDCYWTIEINIVGLGQGSTSIFSKEKTLLRTERHLQVSDDGTSEWTDIAVWKDLDRWDFSTSIVYKEYEIKAAQEHDCYTNQPVTSAKLKSITYNGEVEGVVAYDIKNENQVTVELTWKPKNGIVKKISFEGLVFE